jgi:hypothetical protein
MLGSDLFSKLGDPKLWLLTLIKEQGVTSALTDQGPYEFAVSGAGKDYIDLFNTYLFLEAQIVNTDSSNLDPDTDVPHHARQLRLFSRWYVTEKSFYVNPVWIHAGWWRN